MLLLLVSGAVFAAEPIPVSFQQLLQKPRRYEDKVVAVEGYFDGSECFLSATRTSGYVILINLTETQGKALRSQGLLRSGRVRVIGLFQYIDMTPRVIKPAGKGPEGRAILETRVGFDGGACDKQITNIKKFERAK